MPAHNPLSSRKQSGLFVYLLALTALFMLVEISLFIQSNEAYLGDFKLVSDRLAIPMRVIPGILGFLSLEIILHVIFAGLIWCTTRLIGIGLQCSWHTTEKIGYSLWFLALAIILFANQIYFPNSKFSELTSVLFNYSVAKGLFILCSILFGCALLAAIMGLVKVAPKISLMSLGLILSGIISEHYFPVVTVKDAATVAKPNIILIGVDSLRPDALGYFGNEKITPHFDKFLDQSTVFSNALTPIARTFPAWMSILTGQYPKNNGIRFNLPELTNLNWQNTLPSILQKNGYHTVFATDETRFSNIDKQFGFDTVVTPPVGFNDFLLGTLNDFPMSNLVINTWVGKYFFPHSYGNRPAITTYNPTTFLKLLAPTLAQSRDRSLFLAVHFCLPHYPYVWGSQIFDEKSNKNYRVSIQRVDRQIHDFLRLLQKNNVLQHSVVILLSDHGEAMELPGDRVTEAELFIPGLRNKEKQIPHFYPPSHQEEKVNQSVGHGTDILSMTQYHTVLAFKFYGLRNLPGQQLISQQVSLLDIKPTILKLLNIPATQMDGHELLQAILNKDKANVKPDDFFMETDFSPQSIRSVHPETRELLFEGINFFQVNPFTTRLTVKKSMGSLIVSSKQFADIYGEWILALYPQSNLAMIPILVNLNTGHWTNDLSTAFALASPAQHMLQALQNFYGADLQHQKNS